MPLAVTSLGEQRICHIRVDDNDDYECWGWWNCEWTDDETVLFKAISVLLAEFFFERYEGEYFHEHYEEAMGRPMPEPRDEDIREWLETLPPEEIADLCNYTFKHTEVGVIKLNGPTSVEKVVEREVGR